MANWSEDGLTIPEPSVAMHGHLAPVPDELAYSEHLRRSNSHSRKSHLIIADFICSPMRSLQKLAQLSWSGGSYGTLLPSGKRMRFMVSPFLASWAFGRLTHWPSITQTSKEDGAMLANFWNQL